MIADAHDFFAAERLDTARHVEGHTQLDYDEWVDIAAHKVASEAGDGRSAVRGVESLPDEGPPVLRGDRFALADPPAGDDI